MSARVSVRVTFTVDVRDADDAAGIVAEILADIPRDEVIVAVEITGSEADTPGAPDA